MRVKGNGEGRRWRTRVSCSSMSRNVKRWRQEDQILPVKKSTPRPSIILQITVLPPTTRHRLQWKRRISISNERNQQHNRSEEWEQRIFIPKLLLPIRFEEDLSFAKWASHSLSRRIFKQWMKQYYSLAWLLFAMRSSSTFHVGHRCLPSKSRSPRALIRRFRRPWKGLKINIDMFKYAKWTSFNIDDRDEETPLCIEIDETVQVTTDPCCSR